MTEQSTKLMQNVEQLDKKVSKLIEKNQFYTYICCALFLSIPPALAFISSFFKKIN